MDGTVANVVTKCKRDSLNGTFAWKIEGVGDLVKTLKEQDVPSCHSCLFHLMGCQWKALFWPHGFAKKEFEETASLQLILISSPRGGKQTAKVTLEVSHRPETRKESKLVVFEPVLEAEPSSSLGKPCNFKNFLPHKELFASCEHDALLLELSIELIVARYDRQEQLMHQLSAEQLQELQKTLQSDLLKDMEISCKEGKTVTCNTVLLCKASPVAAAALKYAQAAKLDCSQYSQETVLAMVQFISAAQTPTSPTLNLSELYSLAHDKMIPRLVAVCRSLLLRSVNITNVYSLYELATLFNDLSFIRHLEDYARSNIPQLLKKRPRDV